MAIKLRRGDNSDFNPQKLGDGEVAVVKDTEKVYAGFGGGKYAELAKTEELNRLESETNETLDYLIERGNKVNTDLYGFAAKIEDISDQTSILKISAGKSISLINAVPFDFVDRIKLYGRSTITGTPSIASPAAIQNAGDNGSIKVRSCKKNILRIAGTSQTSNGVEFSVTEDGTIIANGTASAEGKFSIYDYLKLAPNQLLILSGCPKNGDTEQYSINVYDSSFNGIKRDAGNGAIFAVPADGIIHVRVRYSAGTVFSNTEFKPMLRDASIYESDFEAYAALTGIISTPNGFPGIPVSSDGNFMDESGQRWISDEMDFENQKYIKRVGRYTFSESDSWTLNSSGFLYMYISGQNNAGTAVNSSRGLCEALPFINNSTGNGITVNDNQIRIGSAAVSAYGLTASNVAEKLAGKTILWNLKEEAQSSLGSDVSDALTQIVSHSPYCQITNDGICGMSVWYIEKNKEAFNSLADSGNILHNSEWGYALVNQLNHSGYIENNYCISRWIGNGDVIPVSKKHVSLSSGTTMTQRIEIFPEALFGKEYTFSVLVDESLRTVTAKFPTSENALPVVLTKIPELNVEWGFVSGDFIVNDTNSSAVPYLKITAKSNINIKRLFFERGNISRMMQTPIQSKTSILQDCYRYFLRIKSVLANGSSATTLTAMATGFMALASSARVLFPTPVNMRVVPTCIVKSLVDLAEDDSPINHLLIVASGIDTSKYSTGVPCTNVDAVYLASNGIGLRLATSAPFTKFLPCCLRSDHGQIVVDFDANL